MDEDDDFMDVNLTGLDLNREPTSDHPTLRVTGHVGSMANEMENSIEGRIRQLEAVTARARQRQRWRQSRNALETVYAVGESNGHAPPVQRTDERGKGCKRDSSHLVAKALEMDSDAKKPDKEGGGSFYDCNVCLEVARDPVLTCCGHLFCWSCFFQVLNVDSSSKECPVCKGEVSDSTMTPIYGNGDSEGIRVTESGLQIPPRPKASRVEGARQQQVTQQTLLSHMPVAEALRRIRMRIGAMTGGMVESAGGDHHRVRIHQVSRVLSESAASLSSLSSALNNAERLVEDLESVINNRILGNGTRALPVDVGSDLPRPLGVIRSDDETVGPTSSIARSIVGGNFDLESHHRRGARRRRR